jgi:lysozyme family protein
MLTTTGFGASSGLIFTEGFGAAKKTTAVKKTTSSASKADVKRLQAALVALGKAAGSSKLTVAVDGALGAKTVAAVNWAFTQHIGSGQAAAQYRTGSLSQAFVAANAATLAGLIEAEVKRRASVKASPAAAASKGASPVATVATASSASKADVKRLQTALVTLGKVTGSSKLTVSIDGAIGPKTIAAVNWAFTNHIGSGQSPAQYRTGKLTQTQVLGSINTLSSLIETEIKRRGSAAPSASVAKQAELIKGIKAAPTPITKEIAKRLQNALVNLGKITGSATLKAIKVDGAIGAKTVAGVNWAFTKHLGPGQADAAWRTGNLDLTTVKSYAGELARLIEGEINRRGGTPAVAKTATKKAPSGSKTVATATGRTSGGTTVQVKKVVEPSGEEGYEATEPSTGKSGYAKTPDAAASTAEDEAVAATVAKIPSTATAPDEDSGGGSAGDFFSEYKWPLLGGIAVLGLGAALLMRRKGGSSQASYPALPARTRTTSRRRAA